MKKFLSILLAAMMLLATAGVAFADDVKINASVTQNTVINLSSHTFKAYQIFSGTQAAGDTALGDIAWGDGINTGVVNEKTLVEELVAAFPNWNWPKKTEGEGESAKEVPDTAAITAQVVADQLKGKSFNDAEAQKFAHIVDARKTTGTELTMGENTLETGYYLIVDETAVNGVENAVANASLLQVTGNDIVISVKTDKPSQYKKVQQNDTAADKLPTQADYKFSGAAGTDNYNDVADYSIGDIVPFAIYSKVPDMTYFTTYQMKFTDVMSKGLTFKPETLTVTVGTATLTQNTDYTMTYSTDTTSGETTIVVTINELVNYDKDTAIRIDYKAELNENAKVYSEGNPNKSMLEYSNNPDDSSSMGKTPWDEVIVFTYDIDVKKTDESGNALGNAEFVLYRVVGTETQYAVLDANKKVDSWTTTKASATVLTSDATTGLFEVIGLDHGTYYLEETKAPQGYNLLTAPIEVVIDANTKHDFDYTGTVSAAFDATTPVEITADNITVETVTVQNNKGATLPETGGIGTTLFYLIGGLMAAGSALTLVIRRRADADEE